VQVSADAARACGESCSGFCSRAAAVEEAPRKGECPQSQAEDLRGFTLRGLPGYVDCQRAEGARPHAKSATGGVIAHTHYSYTPTSSTT
jgi:hypothetical protein